MQKLINVLALIVWTDLYWSVGGSVYLYHNKDALVETL